LGSDASINGNTGTYVAWCASLPNTKTTGWAGSPTITPSKEIYNTDLGMSIVTYTGNLTAGATIPHSLGKKPGMIIVKSTNLGQGWATYHKDVGATKFLQLDLPAAANTYSGTWNNTEPTSTLITLGNDNIVNGNTDTYIAYIFAETDFCKIGSYTGNGLADGPFVNNGLSASFQIIKPNVAGTPWHIYDIAREPNNTGTDVWLSANSPTADTTYGVTNAKDQTANGTKIKTANYYFNQSGISNLYMTIGTPNGPTENPGR